MLKLRFDPAEIKHWASRYSYPGEEKVEQEVGPRAKERGYLTRDDFLILCRWKTPRALADEHGVSMRTLDHALWQYSKEQQT